MNLYIWLAPLLALTLPQAFAQTTLPVDVTPDSDSPPSLEAADSTESLILVDVIDGVLTIIGGDADDSLSITSPSLPPVYTIQLSSPGTIITSSPTSVVIRDPATALVRATQVSSIEVITGEGNDTIEFDTRQLRTPAPIFPISSFDFDGQDGNDSLSLIFEEEQVINFTSTGPGNAELFQETNGNIYRLNNIEGGIKLPVSPLVALLNFPIPTHSITLTDSTEPGITSYTSPHSPTLHLKNPIEDISLTSSDGDDSIFINSVAPDGFPSFGIYTGDGRGDSITIAPTANLVPQSSSPVALVAETVNHHGSLDMLSSPGNGSIHITADVVNFKGGIFRGNATFHLLPHDASTTIGIGDGSSGRLNLDANDLSSFTDGFSSISIGWPDVGTGDIDIRPSTFTDPIEIHGGNISCLGLDAGANDVRLIAPSRTIQNGGDGDAVIASELHATGILSPGGTGNISIFNQIGDLALPTESSAEFDMEATTSDSLVVTGRINLGSAGLFINNPTPLPAWTTSILISNDGTEPINGTFAGITEGVIVQAGGQYFKPTYVGGDGNDFALTVIEPIVTFDRATYTYGEDGVPTSAQVTLKRDVAAGDSIVNVTFPGTGTATSGIDYNSTPIPVRFTGDELTKAITLTINQDEVVELDEAFEIALVPERNATIGIQDSATITITNDDITTIILSGDDVIEGDSGNPVMVFLLQMDQEVDVPVFAEVSNTAGSATANVDFIPAPGRYEVTTAGTRIEIPIVPDNLAESNESILGALQGRFVDASGRSFRFRNDVNGYLLLYSIIDDDFSPLAFDDGPYEATEDRTLSIPSEIGVLANDSDKDDGNGPGGLAAVLKSQAPHGTVFLESDGSFSYTPRANFFGPDSFTYAASDGSNESTTKTVRINVSEQIDIALGVDVLQSPIVAGGDDFDVFRVTVTNHGPSNASGLILQQTTSLPPGVSIIDEVESTGSFQRGTGIWNLNLTEGASATLTLKVRATSSATSGLGAIPMGFSFSQADQPEVNPTNNTASASASIISADDTGTTITVAPEVELQSGLFVSKVTVSNDSATQPIPAFRLYVRNLPGDVQVYNAQGTRSFGNPPENLPYLLYNHGLAANASVTLTVEFFRASLDPDFTPQYEIELLPFSETEPVAAGGGIPVTRNEKLSNGDFLIEIASTPGATYAVEYSHDMSTWKRVTPTVIAPANRLQWIDNGPPKTESHPSSTPNRYYRFVLISGAP
ncbi:Ig-like domain-containing protein [Haloferula chungangensis]|uniref:Ig-like domain-containing protein n=1 Tax=Haloferula chungangensis TaxID=1048331 RepID=A0ABW2L266_9BACT